MSPSRDALHLIAQTTKPEKDKQGKARDRLDLTIFSYGDGGFAIYTSQVGSSREDVRAVEPVAHCYSQFEAAGALGELVRLIAAK